MIRRITISVWLAWAGCAWGQLTTPAAPPAQQAATDALGRETPRGTMLGFVRAAQRARYSTAAQYLQVAEVARATTGAKLANQLRVLMDHGYFGNLDLISDRREGSVDDGIPPTRERVGAITISDEERLEIELVRVNAGEQGAPVWLVSAETLRDVPAAYQRVGLLGIESHLPEWLVEGRPLQMPLWQWVATLLALPAALGLGRLLVAVMLLPKRLASGSAVAPLTIMAGLFLHWLWIYAIRMPLLYRQYYNRVLAIVLVIVVTWLLWRLIDRAVHRARERAMTTGQVGRGSLLVLGRRVIKVLMATALLLSILAALGFRITPLLTGLGISGIAIALAAQKTIENFIGGVSVLSDQVIRVGDLCQFGDKIGHVEDIGLRSTRIRTIERTELSIPNGAVANMNVENISLRDKIVFKTAFGLRYDTTADQLRCVLADIRRMLYSHPLVETESVRARLLNLGGSALEIEIFLYVMTPDFREFAAAREDILIRVVDIVEAAGTGFAFPSQTIYLSRDRGPNGARAEESARRVSEWRDGSELPFPDYAPATVSAMRGTIAYPPPGSAILPNGQAEATAASPQT
jgi:MscS family membrane protein